MSAKRRRRRSPAGTPKVALALTGLSRARRSPTERPTKELFPLLDGLADLMVLSGVSSGDFARMAKQSFVLAASRTSKFSNGRINASKVAALTGLTRAEVRILLESKEDSTIGRKSNRALRVVAGWVSDDNFTDIKGRPRQLSLKGSTHAFEELVRRYSGDIPSRSILSELQRLGLARIESSRVSLIGRNARTKSRVRDAMVKLNFLVAPTLRAAYSTATGNGKLTGRTLEISVFDRLEADLIRKRATEIVDAAMSALNSLNALRAKRGHVNSQGLSPHIVSISISLSTRNAS